jgi:hypothetical protein
MKVLTNERWEVMKEQRLLFIRDLDVEVVGIAD